MKKYGSILQRFEAVLLAAMTMAMLITGCNKETEKKPPTVSEIASIFAESFTAQTDMTVGLSEDSQDTLALTAVITRSGDCCSVEVTAPEHLEGLSFSIDDLQSGKLTVSYKGLEIQPDSMPGSNLGTILSGALTALSKPEELTVTDTAEGWCVTGQTEAGGFAMLLDSETHYPLSLTLPDARIGCAFTSFETMSVFRPDRIEEDFAPKESSEDSSDISDTSSSVPDSESSPSSSSDISSSGTENSSSSPENSGEAGDTESSAQSSGETSEANI